jgi:Secreted trypsin-like serine protease
MMKKSSASVNSLLAATMFCLRLGLALATSSNTMEEPQNNDVTVFNPKLRIINGDLAPADAYPWFAKGQGCGASLVTPEFVITAAHCSSYRFDRLRIGAVCTGNANGDGTNCGNYFEVRYAKQEFMPPENQDGSTDEYDVRLVQLTERSTIEPVEIDDGFFSNNYSGGAFVCFVCLSVFPWFRFVLRSFGGTTPMSSCWFHVVVLRILHSPLFAFLLLFLGRGNLWTAGFGLTSMSTLRDSDYLLHLEKSYIPFADCQKILQNEEWITVKESMICVQNDDPTRQACFGDSGGPLYDSVNKKLVGVVSTGNTSCSGFPVIYTRLASHVSLLNWLRHYASSLCTYSKLLEREREPT